MAEEEEMKEKERHFRLGHGNHFPLSTEGGKKSKKQPISEDNIPQE